MLGSLKSGSLQQLSVQLLSEPIRGQLKTITIQSRTLKCHKNPRSTAIVVRCRESAIILRDANSEIISLHCRVVCIGLDTTIQVSDFELLNRKKICLHWNQCLVEFRFQYISITNQLEPIESDSIGLHALLKGLMIFNITFVLQKARQAQIN